MIAAFHNYIPNPVAVDLGFYQIRWYGLCLALAVAGGFFVVYKLLKTSPNPLLIKEGSSKSSPPLQGGGLEGVVNLLFWIAAGGIIGGRIVHVLTLFDYYWQRPLQIFSIWNGGIAFYGVFIGGLATAYFLIKKQLRITNHKYLIHNSLFMLLDTLVVGLAFGQFIGRWGNWFNQELFGQPTKMPWGIPIDIWHRPVGFENFQYFHPVFLYESLLMLGLFLLLFWLYRKFYLPQSPARLRNDEVVAGRPPYKGGELAPAFPLDKGESSDIMSDGRGSVGFVFVSFLICHSTVRFFLEFLRLDVQSEFWGLRLFQLVAILEFVLGLLVYFYIRVWYNKSIIKVQKSD